MSRRQVSLVEGTVVNDWLSSILRRLNNNVSLASCSLSFSAQ